MPLSKGDNGWEIHAKIWESSLCEMLIFGGKFFGLEGNWAIFLYMETGKRFVTNLCYFVGNNIFQFIILF